MTKYAEINLDWLTPNAECSNCDVHEEYVCFICEEFQVQEKIPAAILTDDLYWEVK